MLEKLDKFDYEQGKDSRINAKLGHLNYMIENSYKMKEVIITDFNDLSSVDYLGGVELLPEPGLNKYYDIEKITIETNITTPYEIFIDSDPVVNQENFSQFCLTTITDGQTLTGSTIDQYNTIYKQVQTVKPSYIFLYTASDITVASNFTNLLNKDVRVLILNPHDNLDIPELHTFVGVGTIKVKIYYKVEDFSI